MSHWHITSSHHILKYKTTMAVIHTPLQMLSQQRNSHPLPTAILLFATSAINPIKKTIKANVYSQFYSIFWLTVFNWNSTDKANPWLVISPHTSHILSHCHCLLHANTSKKVRVHHVMMEILLTLVWHFTIKLLFLARLMIFLPQPTEMVIHCHRCCKHMLKQSSSAKKNSKKTSFFIIFYWFHSPFLGASPHCKTAHRTNNLLLPQTITHIY